MKHGPDIARIGALVGDPARANMLSALMGGQALTAGELASEAGIAASTSSGHLAQLLDAGLVAVVRQGRHRYYRLSGAPVAEALEALMDVAHALGSRRTRPGPRDPELRAARVCYDHLAGERGVALLARLTDQRLIALAGGAIGMTALGEQRLAAFGIDVVALKAAKRPVCRACLDWSVRRPHLGGGLGAALLDQLFVRGWAHRVAGSRVVRFTPTGGRAFAGLFA
jgi:DNA-binding transcriptional ArsR family regulator